MMSPIKRLSLFCCAIFMVAALAGSDGPVGFVRHYTWRNAATGEEAQGLLAFESTAAGTVHRLYVQAPPGNHVILGVFLDPISGHWHNTVTDDETGIVIEVDKDIGVRADSLQEFFAKSHELTSDKVTAENAVIRRGSVNVQLTIPVLPGWPVGHCRDAVGDIDNKKRDEFTRGLSAAFKRSLLFADSAFGHDSPDGAGMFHCVVNILAELTRLTSKGARTDVGQWAEEVSQPQKAGLTAADQAFLGQFRTVTDKHQPLLGPICWQKRVPLALLALDRAGDLLGGTGGLPPAKRSATVSRSQRERDVSIPFSFTNTLLPLTSGPALRALARGLPKVARPRAWFLRPLALPRRATPPLWKLRAPRADCGCVGESSGPAALAR